MKFASILFSLLLSLSVLPSASAQQSRTNGFRGINLGMTETEIRAIASADGSPWNLVGGDVRSLTADDDENHSSSIGCADNEDGTQACYNFESIDLEYYRGKLFRFTINSPRYDLDEVDELMTKWGEMAGYGLASRYGEPTQSYEITEESLAGWQDGECVYITEWTMYEKSGKKRVENERVRIRMCRAGEQLMYDITFEDLKSIAEQQKKSKPATGKKR